VSTQIPIPIKVELTDDNPRLHQLEYINEEMSICEDTTDNLMNQYKPNIKKVENLNHNKQEYLPDGRKISIV